MKKTILALALAAAIIAGPSTNVVKAADFYQSIDDTSQWVGYMNVFENVGGSKGALSWGSPWGVSDLKSVAGTSAWTLYPNYTCYAYALGSDPGSLAYWTDSVDGGVTAGPNGNQWMQAMTYYEYSPGAAPAATFHFQYNVSAFSLAAGYTAYAFIEGVDPNNGSTDIYMTAPITATGTSQEVVANFSPGSVDLTGPLGLVVRYGFAVEGLNANPANAVANGSVTVQSVPEPSTYALFGMGALVVVVAYRTGNRPRQPKSDFLSAG